jgi:hypothetical protein
MKLTGTTSKKPLEIMLPFFKTTETVFAGKYIEEYGAVFEVAGRDA